MPRTVKFPSYQNNYLFVIRNTKTDTYRTGTKGRTVPKLYTRNPGLREDEEMLIVESVTIHSSRPYKVFRPRLLGTKLNKT
jgi:hypothetical protein